VKFSKDPSGLGRRQKPEVEQTPQFYRVSEPMSRERQKEQEHAEEEEQESSSEVSTIYFIKALAGMGPKHDENHEISSGCCCRCNYKCSCTIL
jgi:hypothetical protein